MAGPGGPEHSELCVNAWSVSTTTDLCCRNEVKCLGQLTPNTAQPSVSQKIGRGMSDISSEAGHPEVWSFLHLPTDQGREERAGNQEQTGVSSVNLLPKKAEAQDSEVSPCLDYDDNTSRGSLVTSCLRIKSSK